MKLRRLQLLNFRCFKELLVEFDPKLTIIIAENGGGKTAILDAVAIGLGRYISKLPGVTGRSTKETDIRLNKDQKPERYLMMQWEANTEKNENIVWSGGRRRDSTVNVARLRSELDKREDGAFTHKLKSIDKYTANLLELEENQEQYYLPVIAYYGTNRAIREEVHRRRNFRKQFSRFDALSNALDSESKFKSAFEWFNAMEDAERRTKESRRDFDYRLPELQLVREAIERIMPDGFSNPRTEIRPLRFVIDRTTNTQTTQTLRISQLSDGYKVVLGLVMDLARRMAQANSWTLNKTNPISPLDLPAIVLIDEVDLHLHPEWQQRIISDLTRTFPETQFIITTHSPQVLSTVKREHIRVISHDSNEESTATIPLAMTYGEHSGDVLQSVMHVDPQPPVKERGDLQKLTEIVDTGGYKTKKSQALMKQLTISLGEQHPQLQKLQRSIKRQEALSKQ
ncbi:AAA family ATPase [Pseudomonas viridiflava]|uniref:AAA family ATPase n=1 Tax=Pseudomonas viridiflava TaxID=33069 RepID=UPI0013CE48A1|nr:AAA family ATPase [Pseudomonas viridiflava]